MKAQEDYLMIKMGGKEARKLSYICMTFDCIVDIVQDRFLSCQVGDFSDKSQGNCDSLITEWVTQVLV